MRTTNNGKPSGLWNRNFTLVWQAHFVSQIGTQLLVVAQILWIKEAAHLATLVGLTSILWTMGCVLAGPLGGSFADTHSRKRIIVVCDFIAGAGSLVIVLLLLLLPGIFVPVYIAVSVLSFVNGVVFSFLHPAAQAMIPDIVPDHRLQQANAFKNSTFQISQLAGQGFGAILFRILGAPLVYLIDGLTYVFSGISSLFIRLPAPGKKPVHGDLIGGARHHWHSMKEGIRFLFREPGLNLIVLTFCAMNFCAAPMIILLPFFVEQNLKLGAEWFGFLMAAFGVGILAGYTGSGIVKLTPRTRAPAWGMALILMSVIAVVAFYFTNAWIILGMFFTAGILNGFTGILFMTGFQKRTPEHLRGRLFGVVNAVAMALMPIGTAVASVVNDLWTNHVPVILSAFFILMLAVTIIVFPNRKVREYLSWQETPATSVD